MVFMPNKSTPDYLFEKANQCFRRSRTDSNARVKLEALGNEFMVKAPGGNGTAPGIPKVCSVRCPQSAPHNFSALPSKLKMHHPKDIRMIRVLISAAALIAFTVAANAEIVCTEHGGCWETGMRIRLPSSPYRGVDTTITDRADPNKRQSTRGMPYVDDTPGHRSLQARR
jgi:hypothetical protein